VSYELELDKQSPQTEFEELISKLEGLGKELVLSTKYEKGVMVFDTMKIKS